MDSVLIKAKIKNRKQIEFFQTIESIKDLFKDKCNGFELKNKSNKNINIRILFDDTSKLKRNINSTELNILKGALISLCTDVEIIQNEMQLNQNI
jgi:hypothetical protein